MVPDYISSLCIEKVLFTRRLEEDRDLERGVVEGPSSEGAVKGPSSKGRATEDAGPSSQGMTEPGPDTQTVVELDVDPASTSKKKKGRREAWELSNTVTMEFFGKYK